MKKAILGRKLGMTQIFAEDGTLIPVTVIEATPNVVLQAKTMEKEGYNSIKVGFEDKREKVTTRPEKGQFKNAETAPKRFVREFRDLENAPAVGEAIDVSVFEAGDMVDVSGISKGHGFAGPIKRWNQKLQGRANVSKSKRSIGALAGSAGSKFATRILKGQHMPGHYGVDNTTVQNLYVVKVDLAENLILVSGSVPGPRKSMVEIRSAVLTNKKVAAKSLVNLKPAPAPVAEAPAAEAAPTTPAAAPEAKAE